MECVSEREIVANCSSRLDGCKESGFVFSTMGTKITKEKVNIKAKSNHTFF